MYKGKLINDEIDSLSIPYINLSCLWILHILEHNDYPQVIIAVKIIFPGVS